MQTFPPDFVFKGSPEEIRKQIGMAVPTLDARQIFEAVLKTLAGVKYATVDPDMVVKPTDDKVEGRE